MLLPTSLTPRFATCAYIVSDVVFPQVTPREYTMPDAISRLSAALEGRYRVEREIGAGGMATVFLAEDLRHKRLVAIKVLNPRLAEAVGAERFLREIETTAGLRHPNILPLYDSGGGEGLLYYVMPFVEGGSLRDRLKAEKQLSIEESIRIATDVCGALEAAHEEGVIHRDVKPENILLDRGHAMVADFGIAQAVSRGGPGRLTGTGVAIGTPDYMSPEQSLGETPDGRSDLYSLGCVLYEMLTGEPPFQGRGVAVLLAKHAVEVPPEVRLRRDTVPGSLSVGHRESALKAARRSVPECGGTRISFGLGIGGRRKNHAHAVPYYLGACATSCPRSLDRSRRRSPALGRSGRWASATLRVSDEPARSTWETVGGQLYTWTFHPIGSALLADLYGQLYAFDGEEWRVVSKPRRSSLLHPTGKDLDGRLLAIAGIGRDGPVWQLLELTANGLTPADTLPIAQGAFAFDWWSDGRELAAYMDGILRLGPTGWNREPTGTTGQILRGVGDRSFTALRHSVGSQ